MKASLRSVQNGRDDNFVAPVLSEESFDKGFQLIS